MAGKWKCRCGREGCAGDCGYAVGERIGKYLKAQRFLKTHLGDIEDDKDFGSRLANIGCRWFGNGDSITSIKKMYDSGVSIETEEKFSRYYDRTAFEMLSEYVEKSGDGAGEKMLEMLEKFNSGALMPVPLQVGESCTIDWDHIEKAKECKDMTGKFTSSVNMVKWCYGSSGMEGYLSFESDSTNIHKEKGILIIRLEDYGKSYAKKEYEQWKNSKVYDNLIVMTRFGYVLPVEFIKGEQSAVFDNVCVYRNTPGKTETLWEYAEGTKVLDERLAVFNDSHLIKSIKENLKYIMNYRGIMAPYLVCDTTKKRLRA